jgi:hypothetical protein
MAAFEKLEATALHCTNMPASSYHCNYFYELTIRAEQKRTMDMFQGTLCPFHHKPGKVNHNHPFSLQPFREDVKIVSGWEMLLAIAAVAPSTI